MIEKVVSAQGLEARAIEDFWSDLGNVAAAALPIVGSVVGSIVPGVGTAIGGGIGALAGGALHAAIGSGQQQPAPPAQPPAIPAALPFPPAVGPVIGTLNPIQYGGSPAVGFPPQFPGTAPAATSQQSAAQLLQLILKPQFLQALLQMVLGSAGSPNVTVPATLTPSGASASGSTAIPVSAFTNLLSTLATQASEAYNAERAISLSAGTFHYGASPWGSSVDVASNEHRAAALWNLLSESGDGGAAAMWARRQRKQRLAELAQALREVDDRRAG